jgi:hypothetical protein
MNKQRIKACAGAALAGAALLARVRVEATGPPKKPQGGAVVLIGKGLKPLVRADLKVGPYRNTAAP